MFFSFRFYQEVAPTGLTGKSCWPPLLQLAGFHLVGTRDFVAVQGPSMLSVEC
jgi:hypothetical protein